MGQAVTAAMSADPAALEGPGAERGAVAGSALRLCVCGVGWTVPAASLRAVAEPGPVTLLPLAPAPADGLVAVEGVPLLQVDGGLLAGASAGERRMLAVLATGAGDIALAVDRVEPQDPSGATLDLARLLPWTGGLRPVERPPRRRPSVPGPAVGLLLVQSGNETVGLRLERVERTGRARILGPLPDGGRAADRLVLLEDRPVAARPLDGAVLPEEPVAILLRGDNGERVALLAGRVLGVEPVEAGRLVAVDHPGGGRSVWWPQDAGPPVRLVDPGPLVGWPPAPPLAAGGPATVRGTPLPGRRRFWSRPVACALRCPWPWSAMSRRSRWRSDDGAAAARYGTRRGCSDGPTAGHGASWRSPEVPGCCGCAASFPCPPRPPRPGSRSMLFPRQRPPCSTPRAGRMAPGPCACAATCSTVPCRPCCGVRWRRRGSAAPPLPPRPRLPDPRIPAPTNRRDR
ncbi:hypothetical protein [Azospirillum thermophilum]|uniref:CheW-like domain-containing protein n=1 Tax=Azospirillum thermophilum TaxID=2202148 RepID=A0A2S2CR11_9PROT|nr:hypothetical protein [Azospirillum thermophilum]AWK86922.1 hypothetical protein DEW08_12400 [Azospirillum thermophilum]